MSLIHAGAHAGAYPDTVAYVGVHGGPKNNDFIDCKLAPRFRQAWHGLKGTAIAQPNTFSPDGRHTYVTTSQPKEGIVPFGRLIRPLAMWFGVDRLTPRRSGLLWKWMRMGTCISQRPTPLFR